MQQRSQVLGCIAILLRGEVLSEGLLNLWQRFVGQDPQDPSRISRCWSEDFVNDDGPRLGRLQFIPTLEGGGANLLRVIGIDLVGNAKLLVLLCVLTK